MDCYLYAFSALALFSGNQKERTWPVQNTTSTTSKDFIGVLSGAID